MKLPYKVSLITVGSTLLISILLSFAFDGGPEIFFVVLGVVSMLVAAVLLFVALILHVAGSKDFGRAFLITSGILFLIGIGVCGPMLAGVGM